MLISCIFLGALPQQWWKRMMIFQRQHAYSANVRNSFILWCFCYHLRIYLWDFTKDIRIITFQKCFLYGIGKCKSFQFGLLGLRLTSHWILIIGEGARFNSTMIAFTLFQKWWGLLNQMFAHWFETRLSECFVLGVFLWLSKISCAILGILNGVILNDFLDLKSDLKYISNSLFFVLYFSFLGGHRYFWFER